MKALLTRISIVLSIVALFAGLASAQNSGVPGDGVPAGVPVFHGAIPLE